MRHVVSTTYFFEKYSKDKKRRLKTNLTLSLILRFNLRLGGYSIWSAIIHRTPYKRRNSGHEHLIASMQPKEYSKTKEVEDYFRSTRRACIAQLRRARGLSDPGPRGCAYQGVLIGLGDRTCPVPYLCCTLHACGVGLVDTEGNYSSCA